MTGFLQKLRVVTLGTAHDLLDKTIDMNSPSAVRQYARDLEEALSKMQNEAAIQAGQVRTLAREKGDLESQIASEKGAITRFLADGKNELARTRGARVIDLQRRLDETSKNLEAQKKTSQQIDEAVSRLETKTQQMVSKVRELERIDRDSKAKEQSAAALESAGRLVSSGVDVSIDDVESKMRARNDVAAEKFDRAMGQARTEEDPETKDAVDDLLAQLQPKKNEEPVKA